MRVFYSMEVGMYIAKIATAAAIIKKKLAGWHCHFPIYAWASNLGIGRHAMTVGLPVTAS